MRKYKVNKDKHRSPTDEEILKYKSFGKLTYEYEVATKKNKLPLYKDPKSFLFLLLILLLVWLITMEDEKEDEKQGIQNNIEQTK